MIAYLALGSNLGNRQAEIASAVRALATAGTVVAHSSTYETEPEGGAVQPRYLNVVVRLETELTARALLDACLRIERAHGRIRPADGSKASRTLDIDIVLFGDEVIASPGLRVPHPALLCRPFVRIPLAEVAAPGLRHPVSGDALDRAPPNPTVRRID